MDHPVSPFSFISNWATEKCHTGLAAFFSILFWFSVKCVRYTLVKCATANSYILAFKMNTSSEQEELRIRILKQVEYYFSDENLVRGKFLQNQIKKSNDGWVHLNILVKFKSTGRNL